MIQAVYKALEIGLAKIVKNGLAFMVMTGVIAGLVWGIMFLMEVHKADRAELKAEIIGVKRECAIEISRLRIDILECQQRNNNLFEQIIRLEERLKKQKR